MAQPNYRDEILPVVDENDLEVGSAPRAEIHAKGLLHRAVHILVFDKKGRIYLQRRSADKDTHPLKWTSSASGHVDPGESYEQAAQRELMEELSLKGRLTSLGKLPPSTELLNEFSWIYHLTTAEQPRPNPAEILEGRFFAWQEALDLANDLERSAPCLKVVLQYYMAQPAF
jgi:isopentenyl-diphosphate delta-isomerase